MVRATLVRVTAACFGTLPQGIEDADVPAVCTRVDNQIDSLVYPDTISGTSELAIELAVDKVLMEIDYILWLQAGGDLSGKPRPSVMPQSWLKRLENLREEGDRDFGTGNMISS